MKHLITAALVALTLTATGLAPVHADNTPAAAPQHAPGSEADVDVGAAIVAGRHSHADNERARRAGVTEPYRQLDIEYRDEDGRPRDRAGNEGDIALGVYVVAPVDGPPDPDRVIPMRRVGLTHLATRADFLAINLGLLELLVHAALSPEQRAIYKRPGERYEFRFMASTNRALGISAAKGPLERHPAVSHNSGASVQPVGLAPLVFVDEPGADARLLPADRQTIHRTICSVAFGSAFFPNGLQPRTQFTADSRAELTYAKTAQTAVARFEYRSSRATEVEVGGAIWSVPVSFGIRKTVARDLEHRYSTTVNPNQYRAITTTLYSRQHLLRCMYPNPFQAHIELTRPHQYAEYHPEVSEGLVPRGRIEHQFLYSCAGQAKTKVGNRDTGGTWEQHRSESVQYNRALRLYTQGMRSAGFFDIVQRIGRGAEVSMVYEKVHRGNLVVCGFNGRIPSQSVRVRTQGGCNPQPCQRVAY